MSEIARIVPVPVGEYDENKIYNRLDIISYHRGSYLCKMDDVQGIDPEDTTVWQLLALGDAAAENVSYTDKYEVGVNNAQDALDTAIRTAKLAFQSGSDFKTDVAAAITAKGIQTAADADKNVFVKNIGQISTGFKYREETISFRCPSIETPFTSFTEIKSFDESELVWFADLDLGTYMVDYREIINLDVKFYCGDLFNSYNFYIQTKYASQTLYKKCFLTGTQYDNNDIYTSSLDLPPEMSGYKFTFLCDYSWRDKRISVTFKSDYNISLTAKESSFYGRVSVVYR